MLLRPRSFYVVNILGLLHTTLDMLMEKIWRRINNNYVYLFYVIVSQQLF